MERDWKNLNALTRAAFFRTETWHVSESGFRAGLGAPGGTGLLSLVPGWVSAHQLELSGTLMSLQPLGMQF